MVNNLNGFSVNPWSVINSCIDDSSSIGWTQENIKENWKTNKLKVNVDNSTLIQNANGVISANATEIINNILLDTGLFYLNNGRLELRIDDNTIKKVKGENGDILSADIKTSLTQNFNSVPVGTIISFGGNIDILQAELGYDPNSPTRLYYDGTSGISVAGPSPTPSANWLLCKGDYVPVSAYPILYKVLAGSWGNEKLGEAIKTHKRFKLPNLQQEYLIGSYDDELSVRSKC